MDALRGLTSLLHLVSGTKFHGPVARTDSSETPRSFHAPCDFLLTLLSCLLVQLPFTYFWDRCTLSPNSTLGTQPGQDGHTQVQVIKLEWRLARDTRLRRGKKSGKSSWRKCRLHQDLKNKLESAGPDRVGRGEGSIPEKRHSVSKDWRQQEGGSRKPPGLSTQAPSLRKQSQRNRGQASGSCWKGITV